MTDFITAAMGPGGGSGHGGGGGGGHGGGGGETEEAASNSLSYPVIFTDGLGVTLAGSPNAYTFESPYDLNGDGQITAGNWDPTSQTGGDQIDDYYLFAQKTAGNVWQADSVLIAADEDSLTNLFVSTIDWGDSIEGGKPIGAGKPTRIEISFYKNLSMDIEGDVELPDAMTAYPMQLLANPSSPTEVQGASAASYPLSGDLPNSSVLTLESTEASVYSQAAKLTVQYLVGAPESNDFLWNGDYWVDADATDSVTIEAPTSALSFGGEVTVGGKVVYGVSKGGWRPEKAGSYRATVYFPKTGNLQLALAEILTSTEESEAPTAAIATGGEEPPTETLSGAQIDGLNNLTYLDLFVEGNQPPVVQPIVLATTEDDPDLSISLIGNATDPEGDELTAGNVTIVANNGTSPVTLPTGTAELQGSNLLIRPSLLNYLNAGEKVILQASFSVSDGVNLTPSTATITVDGRDESAPPSDTGGSGGGGDSGGGDDSGGGGGLPTPPSSENPGAGGNGNPGVGGGTPPGAGNAPTSPNEPNFEQPPTSLKGHRTFQGTGEADVITGSKKKDLIIGGAGNDQLNGRKGNDKLYGEFGDDVLIGGSGMDFLDGGIGFDLLTGGKDRDTFRISLQAIRESNGQPDRILDFNLRKDRLDLDDSIKREMLSFGNGMLMAQIDDQLVPLVELSGLTNPNLTSLIQLV